MMGQFLSVTFLNVEDHPQKSVKYGTQELIHSLSTFAGEGTLAQLTIVHIRFRPIPVGFD